LAELSYTLLLEDSNMLEMKPEVAKRLKAILAPIEDAQPQKIVHLHVDSKGEITLLFQLKAPRLDANSSQTEEALQELLKEAGLGISAILIKSFDVNDQRLVEDGEVYYSKGESYQVYKTIYGSIRILRHIYQHARGGKTMCPLEVNGSFFLNSTPLLAKIIASKTAEMGSLKVNNDLLLNNGVKFSRRYIKSLSDTVGELAIMKEDDWTYEYPSEILPNEVATISLGLDGTAKYPLNEGECREAIVGFISIYDEEGKCLHTIYTGASAQHGKEKFLAHLDKEWERAKKSYPKAFTQGVTDGSTWTRKWLEKRTEAQILDFFQVSNCINAAALAIFKENVPDLEVYVSYWHNFIKSRHTGVNKFLEELGEPRNGQIVMECLRKKIDLEVLNSIIDFLKRQIVRAAYYREVIAKRPIGSGETESASNLLIIKRLYQSGMRWNDEGASNIIAIRSLMLTPGRWEQFWTKVTRYGGYARLMGKIR
jgi:hypothetical protein